VTKICDPNLRSLAVGDYVIIHSIVEDDVVLILHVVLGSRDLVALLVY
jgi:mRNA-degrading endonuclease RelE of RelBE toxin-antitoxin system